MDLIKTNIEFWDNNVVASHIGGDIQFSRDYFNKIKKTSIKMIDIGANVGKVYDLLKKEFIIEKCIMIEPCKNLYEYMQEKYKNDENVKIYNFGISELEGMFNFFDTTDYIKSESDNINLGVGKINNIEGNVQCYKMETFLNNFNTINPQELDLIKIDTENKDLFIIRDLTEWISSNKIKPFILFEINYHQEMSLEAAQAIIDNFCLKCGYKHVNLETAYACCYLEPL